MTLLESDCSLTMFTSLDVRELCLDIDEVVYRQFLLWIVNCEPGPT